MGVSEILYHINLLFVPSSGSPDQNHLTYAQNHTPEIAGLPWSSPVYKNVIEAKTWPRPAACYRHIRKNTCKCFTDQATLLNLDKDVCLLIVKNGFFDWTKEPIRLASARLDHAPRRESRRANDNIITPVSVLISHSKTDDDSF